MNKIRNIHATLHRFRPLFVVGAGLIVLVLLAQTLVTTTYSAGQPYRIYNTNFFLCLDNPCTATAPSSAGNLIIEGALKMTGGSPGASKVLTSDANGVASWTTPSSSGWTDDGTAVRLTTGTDSVGIGTTTPGGKLDVTGTSSLNNSEIDANGNWEVSAGGSGNRYAYFDLHGDDTNTDYSTRFIRMNTGVNANTSVVSLGTGAFNVIAHEAGSIQFMTQNSPRMTILSGGNIGIGTTDPDVLLHIQGGGALFRYNTGTNQGAAAQGQLTLTDAGGGTGVWFTFDKIGVYDANFGLETDNWFSTRGWSAGANGYTPLRYGNLRLTDTQPEIFFEDSDSTEWSIWSAGGNNFAFTADQNDDGGDFEVIPLNITTTTTFMNDLECTGCIDQGDMKTNTGVTAGFTAVDVQTNDYAFFPQIEWDNCATANGADTLAPRSVNTANDTVGGFRVNLGCTNTSTSWKVRYRYVDASRDQEIFAWYDPSQGLIQQMWIGEVELTAKDQLPTVPVKPQPNWIPVQATIFDRDLARMNQNIDIDNIMHNYDFTQLVAAKDVSQDDELVRVPNEEREKCLVTAKETSGLDNPEGKCFQFITHPDIYYGKLERSPAVTRKWQEIAVRENRLAAQNKLVTQSDVAENYSGQADVTPGEIIAIDRAQNNFLVRATAAESQQLAGVVSTSPGQVLGQEQENNIELALVGRVPVKMSQTSTAVRPGDMITVSAEAGKGAKATQAGWVVGKALESWTPNSGKDTVLVLLNTSGYDPQLVQKSLDGYQLAKNDDRFEIKDTFGQIIDRVLALKDGLIARVTAGKVLAQSLYLGETNIAEKLTQLEEEAAAINRETQNIGFATLPADQQTLFVSDSRVTTTTKVFVTPSQTTNRYFAVTAIRPGQGFEVAVTQPGPAVAFNYWLVE